MVVEALTVDQIKRLEAEILEMERRKGLQDLYYFDKHILCYSDMRKRPHRQVCDFVMDWSKSRKKLIQLPRGSFKSSVITIGFPVWKLAQNPDLRILIDNEVYANSKAFLREIKGHLENPRVLEMYPQLEPDKRSNEGWTESSVIVKGRTKKRKEPSISCAGIDQIKVGMHYDIIIMDDLVSPRNITTKEQIEKVIEHYKYAMSLLEPDGLMIVVGTRYHYSDLYGYLLENESDTFEDLILPAISEDGTLLFPSRLTLEFLEEQRASQGTYIYNCQYMLDPVDEETAEFKKSWLRYYDAEVYRENGKWFIDVKKIFDHNLQQILDIKPFKAPIDIYLTMDPASKKKKKSDWTTLCTNGVTEDNKWFILDLVRDKLNPRERVDIVFDQVHKWSPKMTGIEDVGFQDTIQFYAIERMKKDNFFFRIQALSTGGQAKEDRILKIQPRFEHGQIFLPRRLIYKAYDGKSYDMVQEFLTEYAFFPLAKHDDLLDVLAYQADLIPNKRNKEKKRRKGKATFIKTR